MTGTSDRVACITCGDVAATLRVVGVRGMTAIVEAGGQRELVGIELVQPVAVGDVLVCHAGIALQKAAPEAADSLGAQSSSSPLRA
jgi:hydrogenase maturation factor